MLISGVFCFLWDDPLFTNQPVLVASKPRNQELLKLRRQALLTALDILYARISNLEKEVLRQNQGCPRLAWIGMQLLQHVSPAVAQRLKIDLAVNDIDPDFSYGSAIRERSNSSSEV